MHLAPQSLPLQHRHLLQIIIMSDVEMGDDVPDVPDVADVAAAADGTRDFNFTETTTESYGGKLKDSCGGAIMGLLIFVVSIVLLFWNEGRAVNRAKDLDEGGQIVVEIDLSDFVQNATASNSVFEDGIENKLIHVTGMLTTASVLVDPIFGVSSSTGRTDNTTTSALRLRRFVEMYQWQESSQTKETKTSTGGTRKETTYSYDKIWSSNYIDSTQFRNTDPQVREQIQNPRAFPFEPLSLEADPIYLGDKLALSSDITRKFKWYEPLNGVSIDDILDASIKPNITTYSNNGFYYSSSSSRSAAEVGDTRITFDDVEAETISIVAKYVQSSLGTYTTSRGGLLLLVERGVVSAEEMFLQAEAENEQLTWILRFIGFILMVVSILLVLQPIATAVDIIPFVGDCMQGGLEKCLFPLIALLISIPISILVIALAWVVYRPYIGIPLAIISGIACVWLCVRGKKQMDESPSSGQQQPSSGGAGHQAQPYGKPSPYGQPPQYGQTTPAYGTAPMYNAYGQQQPAAGAVPSSGGFAQALDQPPPPQQPAFVPPPPQQPSYVTEPDVVVAVPVVEPDVYVPNYK